MRCSCGQPNPVSANRCSKCGGPLVFGSDPKRLALDAAMAGGLLLALGLVLLLDRGQVSSGAGDAGPDTGSVEVEVVEGPLPEGAGRNRLRLAVTPPEYDDLGKLLGELGEGYRYTDISLDDLLDPAELERYDVVFLTCGGVPRSWLGGRVGAADRGTSMHVTRPEIVARIRQSLRHFVGRGGTLYVSDWQFDLLAIAFAELIDQAKVARGEDGTIVADVVDPGLRRLVGATLPLRFDKRAWRPAAFKESLVTTYVRGTLWTTDRRSLQAPLLVRFPFEDGQVVFTSFHNEKQNTETEQRLLRYLVFATVTAGLDEGVKRTMLRGGFSPVDRSLLSASSGDQSVTETYHCAGERSLKFVLAFQDQGARLRLAIVGPDGGEFEQSGESTFSIDVPRAAAGEWTYTVTPLKVPYENFPFTLTIGEKQ